MVLTHHPHPLPPPPPPTPTQTTLLAASAFFKVCILSLTPLFPYVTHPFFPHLAGIYSRWRSWCSRRSEHSAPKSSRRQRGTLQSRIFFSHPPIIPICHTPFSPYITDTFGAISSRKTIHLGYLPEEKHYTSARPAHT